MYLSKYFFLGGLDGEQIYCVCSIAKVLPGSPKLDL